MLFVPNKIISGQMNEFIQNNRNIQLFIAFMVVIVLANLMSDIGGTDLICLSVVLYLCFLISTKLELQWNLIIVAILTIGYFYCDECNDIVIGALALVAAIGFIAYVIKKKEQYGDGFDIDTFLFNYRNN